jgi:5-methylcytosine-specific restriction endonuclease McrA
MKKHTKIYMDYFGYGKEDFISCEVCGKRAVDIHHINARGMGGSKEKDSIDNLMAVCRECHIAFGDIKEYMDFLKEKHQQFIDSYGKFY